MLQTDGQVQEKNLDAVLIAGVRIKGRYSDSSKGFAKLGKSFGRLIAGPPIILYYDNEYKEDDADFEVCFPVKQAKTVDGISVRELAGALCVTLVHKGPYDQMGPAYAKSLKYAREKGYAVISPTRQICIKGPGMIFKGNPKNYITEIQLPVENAGN